MPNTVVVFTEPIHYPTPTAHTPPNQTESAQKPASCQPRRLTIKNILSVTAHVAVLGVLALLILTFLNQQEMMRQIQTQGQQANRMELELRQMYYYLPQRTVVPWPLPTQGQSTTHRPPPTYWPQPTSSEPRHMRNAEDFFSEYPGQPAKAFWAALTDSSVDSAVVLTIAVDSRCGMGRKVTAAEVDLPILAYDDYRQNLSLLMLATIANRVDVCRALVANGAVLGAADSRGYNALHWAALDGYADIVELLLLSGLSPNTRANSGATPLHEAAWNAHLAVIELLVAKGANVSLRKYDNASPNDLSMQHINVLSSAEQQRLRTLLPY